MARKPGTRHEALQHCMERLEHGVRLARIAAKGVEPEYGALHLLHALKAIEKDLPFLRGWVRARGAV